MLSQQVCDAPLVVLGRAPVSGVLRFVERDDWRDVVRFTEPDRVTPKNWPAGSLWLDVLSDGSNPVVLGRWDWVIVGADASVSIPVADWSAKITARAARFQWKWLAAGSGAGSSGLTLVSGPVVRVW